MPIRLVSVKGHYHPAGGKLLYDGRITFCKEEMPDVVEIDGTLFQKVEKPAGYVNPEMHMQRETR